MLEIWEIIEALSSSLVGGWEGMVLVLVLVIVIVPVLGAYVWGGWTGGGWTGGGWTGGGNQGQQPEITLWY